MRGIQVIVDFIMDKLHEGQSATARRKPYDVVMLENRRVIDGCVGNAIIANLPHLLMVLNDCRQIVYANRAALSSLGMAEDELIGRRPGEALGCSSAAESAGGCGLGEKCSMCGALMAIMSALDGGHSKQECRICRDNGEALNLQVWSEPLELDGQTYVVLMCLDISEKKRLESLERIFFHDLLNTAGGIYGSLKKIASDAGSSPGNLRVTMSGLLTMASRLIGEIQTQKTLLAAEQNTLPTQLDSVDSNDLIKDVLLLYRNHELADGRMLVVDQDSDHLYFYSDFGLLYRVVSNMVKNALEATERGSAITVGCVRDGDNVVFSVHNPGHIPRDVQLQIFQRSFSTKGQGRGLGTYSMRMLSRRYLGGDVSFTSTIDHGTTFRGVYPYRPVSPEQPAYDVLSALPTELLRRKRILLVDDNLMQREILSWFLDEVGAIVTGVESGEKALAMVARNSYDLILMDRHMEGMNGEEIFRIIRSREQSCHIPIISMSGDKPRDDEQPHFGMDDSLTKPVEANELYRVLGKWLQQGVVA